MMERVPLSVITSKKMAFSVIKSSVLLKTPNAYARISLLIRSFTAAAEGVFSGMSASTPVLLNHSEKEQMHSHA